MNTDDFIFTFGKHRGKELDDVPAAYLLWFADQENCPDEVKLYVKKYRRDLESEAEGDKEDRYR